VNSPVYASVFICVIVCVCVCVQGGATVKTFDGYMIYISLTAVCHGPAEILHN